MQILGLGRVKFHVDLHLPRDGLRNYDWEMQFLSERYYHAQVLGPIRWSIQGAQSSAQRWLLLPLLHPWKFYHLYKDNFSLPARHFSYLSHKTNRIVCEIFLTSKCRILGWIILSPYAQQMVRISLKMLLCHYISQINERKFKCIHYFGLWNAILSRSKI